MCSPKFASILSVRSFAEFNLLSLLPVNPTAFFHTVQFFLFHQEILLENVSTVELNTDRFLSYYLFGKILLSCR